VGVARVAWGREQDAEQVLPIGAGVLPRASGQVANSPGKGRYEEGSGRQRRHEVEGVGGGAIGLVWFWPPVDELVDDGFSGKLGSLPYQSALEGADSL